MNLNFTKILFMNTIMIGVMMAISSNNWISLWTSMEIGVLSIIPLMTQEKTSSDSPIKYFIIQSISSSMMISSLMSMMMKLKFKIIMIHSMLMKIGASPYHIWMLSMVEGMEMYVMFMMLTVIKIPGLISLSIMNEQLKMWSVLSMIIGSIMVINQTSLKKMLTYSSIYNLGVMMTSINENQIWVSYFLVYILMLILITATLSKLKINYLNQMMTNEVEKTSKMTMWVSVMSMAGFPPMMGFSIKMMILESIILKKEIMLASILLASSMIMMFMYMRISFLSIVLSSTLMKWKLFKKSNMDIKILAFNLIMTPTVMTLKSLL